MAKTVVGIFDNTSAAQSAMRDLVAAGFARDDISLMANDSARPAFERDLAVDDTAAPAATTRGEATASKAAAGAGIGAAAGLALGLVALAIPGIGPVVAAGPIATLLAGAGIGAAAGGAIGAMTSAGIPEAHAKDYAEAIRRGDVMLMLNAPDERADEAADILSRDGAVDIDQRAAAWRQPAAAMDTAAVAREERDTLDETVPARTATAREGEQVLPVVEEQIAVGKRPVERGGVRVYSNVIEQPVEQQVRLREEKVNVERRPVDRPVTGQAWDSFREGTIEVTERAEEPVVQKQARVVEEVVVNKQARERVETVRDTVRRTDVKVEPIQGGAAGVRGFDAYDADFRRDYQSAFASSGQPYEYYQPAYRYGYDLANDPRYAGRDWSAIESDVRRDWDARYPGGTWDRMKAAVRTAWDKARSRV